MLKRKNIKAYVEDLKAGKIERKIYETGIRSLDDAIEGGIPEGLTVLGGAPGYGKSTLAFQIASNMCAQGRVTTIYSLEMDGLDFAEKDVARQKRRVTQETDKGRVDIVEAYEGLTLELLIEDIEDTVSANDNSVIIIDYLQLIKPKNSHLLDSKLRVDECVQGLHEVSKRCHIPIIVISSLNREAYKKNIVDIFDFKESGKIEYSAALILAIEKDGNQTSEDERACRIRVLKNRGRRQPLEPIQLTFYAKYASFEERDNQYSQKKLRL